MPRLPEWLLRRCHIVPGTLARSPGNVGERFPTPVAALAILPPYLQRLPAPLLAHWQTRPGGHIVLNAREHAFVAGPNTYRGRTLDDVAWLRLSELDDPVYFLRPVGELVLHLLGWEQEDAMTELLKTAGDLRRGVRSCFAAGLGLRPDSRRRVELYLAEGIAHYLADRRALNLHDPALEKLLRATLFEPRAYRPAAREP